MASAVINAAPGRRPGARTVTPGDFVPRFEGARREREHSDGLDPARIKAEFLSTFGNRIKRKVRAGNGRTN